ncbi:hypothetical protein [Akkermansia sp.]|uniref:hypothetical protein n=1 Tax=Akkermansia sp. TaxID=1872421 RepID=UPI003AB4B63A
MMKALRIRTGKYDEESGIFPGFPTEETAVQNMISIMELHWRIWNPKRISQGEKQAGVPVNQSFRLPWSGIHLPSLQKCHKCMRPNKSAPCKVPDSKKRRSIFPSLCFGNVSTAKAGMPPFPGIRHGGKQGRICPNDFSSES